MIILTPLKRSKTMCDFSQKIKTLIRQVQQDNGEKQQTLYEGIAKYLTIKRRYDSNEILCQPGVRKPEFQIAFNNFYRIRGQVNRQNLWELIAKRVVREPHEQAILDAIISISKYRPGNGRIIPTIQLSFATKAFHTIRNDLPIYDNIVGKQFFELAVRQNVSYEQRLASAVECYAMLCGYYERRYDNGLQELVAVYDKLVKHNDRFSYKKNIFSTNKALTLVSDVKKIDFMIWSFR